MTLVAIQAEAKFQNVLLLFAEMAEPAAELFVMNALLNDVERLIQGGIGDEITEKAATFLTVDRGIEAAGGQGLTQ